jgi:hypothetical protein
MNLIENAIELGITILGAIVFIFVALGAFLIGGLILIAVFSLIVKLVMWLWSKGNKALDT